MADEQLAGLTAVVTGSGGMMGGAIAVELARKGASIVLNDRRAGSTQPYGEQIEAAGGAWTSVEGNVTRRAEACAVIHAGIDRWGKVDILVNTVGGIRGQMNNPVWEISEEDFEFAIGLNLRGTFHCTKAVLPGMMERRFGKIVNIASNSWGGEPMHAHYAAAKAAVVSFTRACAIQLGPYNINVNAVAPGATATSVVERSKQESVDLPPNYERLGTLPRINDPEDIANAVRFLVSEDARNISGQILSVASGANPRL